MSPPKPFKSQVLIAIAHELHIKGIRKFSFTSAEKLHFVSVKVHDFAIHHSILFFLQNNERRKLALIPRDTVILGGGVKMFPCLHVPTRTWGRQSPNWGWGFPPPCCQCASVMWHTATVIILLPHTLCMHGLLLFYLLSCSIQLFLCIKFISKEN